MVEAFGKLRANTMLGGVVYKDYNAAMLELSAKSWVQPLIAKIEAEVSRPQNRKDKGGVEDYMDQSFWQTTAAAVLGRIGDPAAVEPLIKVVLDPEKVDFHQTAVVSLIQLGKPASDAAIGLLKGTNANLQSYCVKRIKDTTGAEPKGKPCAQTAAVIIGAIGRPEAAGAMIEVLRAETDNPAKVMIARELSRLPAEPNSIAAFKEAFESLQGADIPDGMPGVDVLTEAAAQFFDAGLVSWLLERAQNAKGDADERKALQLSIVLTVIKLAKPDQLAAVKRAVDNYGTDLEKGVYKQAEALLKACGDRANCYVEALQKPENQDRKSQFVGIKAGYMAAIFGNEQTRDEIVSRLDAIDNAAVRFVAAQAIDRLSPKGAKAAVEKIGLIIDKNAKSPDRDKAQGDAPLKQVMYRLQARGG
jgi:HEAT repeat protein